MPPQKVTCENDDCQKRFDPHRTPEAVGASAWRCRFCGRSHDPRDYPEVRNQASASSGGAEAGHMTLDININTDGVTGE